MSTPVTEAALEVMVAMEMGGAEAADCGDLCRKLGARRGRPRC